MEISQSAPELCQLDFHQQYLGFLIVEPAERFSTIDFNQCYPKLSSQNAKFTFFIFYVPIAASIVSK